MAVLKKCTPWFAVSPILKLEGLRVAQSRAHVVGEHNEVQRKVFFSAVTSGVEQTLFVA